jgi:phytoene dehydrogenase-like protein
MSLDTVVIGAGHNGLVAAAYLAMAGQRVLVLERRDVLGGAAATEALFPGFRVNTGAPDAGLFLPRIASDLKLDEHGLELIESPAAVCALQPGGPALTLWRDVDRSREEIGAWSSRDAERYPDFVDYMGRMARALRGTVTLTPPEPHDGSVRDLMRWLRPALRLKGMGRRDMMEFLRILPMSAAELLDDWFESDALKGALGTSAVLGSMQGPLASGTAFRLLYHYLGTENGGFRSSAFVRGGMGRLSEAIAAAARAQGAEIRTGTSVADIVVRGDAVIGVRLDTGEELSAHRVVSSVDPRRTLHGLLGAPTLGPELNRRICNIRYRGSTAALHLALDGPPEVPGTSGMEPITGHVVVSPSLVELERAYDDAKYGRFSARPCLDMVIPTLLDPELAPAGHHILSVTVRYAPYRLKQGGWDEQRGRIADTILERLEAHLPGLSARILHQHLITPLDWEREYGLTEGGTYHGQMDLDQLLFMRPVPGWGQYRMPVAGLYLCGSGTHPGGGVTGAPGFNAAREVLRA